MKYKRVMAIVLASAMMAGSVPVYAGTVPASKDRKSVV